MTALLLTGKEPARNVLDSLRLNVQASSPKLVIIYVGEDPASESYIRKKLEACRDIGMQHELLRFPVTVDRSTIMETIQRLNNDTAVSGYIIQLPLPELLRQHQPILFRAIDPMKDVDCFTAYNIGKMFLSTEFEHLPPATPAGVVELLHWYRIPLEGKHVVIVGSSNIVGKPLAVMLANRNATVTICNEFTQDLALHTKRADILVSAVGHPGLIGKKHIKSGAVIIDIGMTKTDRGMEGDVQFEEVVNIASAITPVPGGIGPLTVACLLRNTVTAKLRQLEKAQALS